MGSRHFENKARQSFWLVHIEAWRRSGLSQRSLSKHRLARNVFARWLKYLAGEEAARKHVEYQRELHREERRQQREKRGKKPQRRRYGCEHGRAQQGRPGVLSDACRSDELERHGRWRICGCSVAFAGSLRKWHGRFEDGEVEIDWRAHLHQAPAEISTSTEG